MTATTTATDELRLPDHHQRLEQWFKELAYEARQDETLLRDSWKHLERELEQHLLAEERSLLPRFAVEQPELARALADDHARIRAEMAELGVSLDLHALRAERAERLIALLRAHAQKEDETLYPWARRNIPLAGLRSLMPSTTEARLRARLDELRLQIHLGSKELRDTFEQIRRDVDRAANEAQPIIESMAKKAMDRLEVLAQRLKERIES